MMRMIAATMAMALIPTLAVPDLQNGDNVIDCYCTDTFGQRVELGESVCLFVDGRSFIARCEMALNNPVWRDTGVDCNMSQSRPERLNNTLG